MIVVDTNVTCYLYLSTEHSEAAEQLFRKNPEWSAPLLWRSEFRNVLSQYIKKEIITLNDAIQIFGTAESVFQHREYEVNAMQVLKLSQQSGCSAYDCEFVNLAQDLNVPLVTMDKKMLHSFPDTAISIQGYLESD